MGNLQDQATNIEKILFDLLPIETVIKVKIQKTFFGDYEYIIIMFGCPYNGMGINNPSIVSLSYNFHGDKRLIDQIFGGVGGRCVDRKIDPNNDFEKYLCQYRETISFRKTNKNIEANIIKFAKRWLKIIALIEAKGQLLYEKEIDYTPFVEAGKLIKI